MDPFTAAYTALMTVLSQRSKSPLHRTIESAMSVLILTVFLGMILETLSRNEVTFEPVSAVYQIATVLGLSDTEWIDATIRWLERPALSPLAVVASLLSGILVFWAARYSGETAWLLLLAFSVTLGSQAFLLAGYALAATTFVLGLVGWIMIRFELDDLGIGWLGPGFVINQSVRGLFVWSIVPFTLVFRLINGVIGTVTYKHRELGVASGAVSLPRD